MSGISRRQFLRGDVRGSRTPVRPPWAIAQFSDRCNRCGACLEACPGMLLQRDGGGYPAVDFRRGACRFCGACAQRCEHEAFGPTAHGPWEVKAVVSEECLTWRGVVCRTCAEQCEASAVRFRLVAGAVAKPEITLSSCTGCGACYRPCPVGAISMQQLGRTDFKEAGTGFSVGAYL